MALAPSRRDATAGSALDGALSRRKDRRHRWTAARTDRLSAVPETRVTASNHRPAGSGDSRPASAAAPGSASAREGEAQPTPRAQTDPRPIPRLRPGPSGHARTLPRSHLRHFASSALDQCAGSARAWREPRASALEVVEKVVAPTRLLPAPRKVPAGNFHRPWAYPYFPRRPYKSTDVRTSIQYLPAKPVYDRTQAPLTFTK